MSNAKITIVEATEWQGLYVDGELRCQGDIITSDDIARHIPGMYVKEVTDNYDEKMLCVMGGFPQYLIDVEVK